MCRLEPLLAPLGRLLDSRAILDDATAVKGLNLVQGILPAAGRNSRVLHAQSALLRAVLQAVSSLDGPADYRDAAWFHDSCRDVNNKTLLSAIADALLRCQPIAPTPGYVATVMEGLLDAKVLPRLGQWVSLFQIFAVPSLVSQLDGTAVLELLTLVQLLLRGNQGSMPLDAAHSMQPLFAAVASLFKAGRADLQQCVEVMAVCASMLVVPEALVAQLNKQLRWRDIEGMTWHQVFILLKALADLGFGDHQPDEQPHIPQPLGLLKDLLKHCLNMSRKQMPPRCVARGLACICAYLNLNNSTTADLIDVLSLYGFDLFARDASMHQLYQGQVWLKAHGWARTRGLDFAALQDVRWRVINGGYTSACNQAMCRQLQDLQQAHPHLIRSVSYCDYVVDERNLLISVDCLLVSSMGRNIVVEFDGPTHWVGPRGNLTGSTLWRNLMLRKNGFVVVSISHTEWDGKRYAQRQALLWEKLRPYL